MSLAFLFTTWLLMAFAPAPAPVATYAAYPASAGATTTAEPMAWPQMVNAVGGARLRYGATGKGFTAVVIDSGLRLDHVDFEGRIPTAKNFAPNTLGVVNGKNADDETGHGTHVAGIIAANGVHQGIAPEANIIPLKIFTAEGTSELETIDSALRWTLEHRKEYNVTVVNLSWSLCDNARTNPHANAETTRLIEALAARGVAVVAASGNNYYTHGSAEGMGYPAIVPQTISVASVYDANIGADTYNDGASAFSTGADRVAPFSQRLHPSTDLKHRTDILAPGASIASSGIDGPRGSMRLSGTSVSAPVVAGTVLLMQEIYFEKTGHLPTLNQIETWLQQSSVWINDGDDEDDNVVNTGKVFPRLDMAAALDAAAVAANGPVLAMN